MALNHTSVLLCRLDRGVIRYENTILLVFLNNFFCSLVIHWLPSSCPVLGLWHSGCMSLTIISIQFFNQSVSLVLGLGPIFFS